MPVQLAQHALDPLVVLRLLCRKPLQLLLLLPRLHLRRGRAAHPLSQLRRRLLRLRLRVLARHLLVVQDAAPPLHVVHLALAEGVAADHQRVPRARRVLVTTALLRFGAESPGIEKDELKLVV